MRPARAPTRWPPRAPRRAGTAFLDCPEAGTAAVHRAALRRAAQDAEESTLLTRAFSGRTARGIANGFLLAHSAAAPAAYPEVNYLTAPMRAKARQAGLPGYVNLWAGQACSLARSPAVPAGDLVRDLWAEAGAVLDRVGRTRSV